MSNFSVIWRYTTFHKESLRKNALFNNFDSPFKIEKIPKKCRLQKSNNTNKKRKGENYREKLVEYIISKMVAQLSF